MGLILARVAVVAVCGVPACLAAAEPGTLAQEIAAQPMDSALRAYEEQTGRIVAYGGDILRGKWSRRARAGLALDRALCKLLEGSGLTFDNSDPPNVVISVAAGPAEPCEPPLQQLDEVLVLPMACRDLDPSPACPRRGAEDVLDTLFSQTRGTRSRELDGDAGIDATARLLPGLDWTQLSSVSGNIYTILAIYGVIDRHGNTTGIWWDRIPLPAATSNTFARTIPYNFDLEVTPRYGPQPVLLGANAQSGALEYMPAQPDLHASTGQLRSEWAMTEGGDPTRELGVAWGGPLSDGRLAFRISGWYRTEGGYVDRVDPFAAGRPVVDANSNELTMRSARLALRYQPNDSLTLMPSFVYQSTTGRDSPSFMIWDDPDKGPFSDPAAGRFLNGSIIRQPISDSFRLASLRANARVGPLQLEGVTGYIRRFGFMISDDATSLRWRCLPNAQQPACAYPSGPEDLITTQVNLAQRSFSQQLQLTYEGASTSWLLGGFFSDLHSRETDRVFADPVPYAIQAYYSYLASLGQTVPGDFFWQVPTTIRQRQLAGFTQVSQRLLDNRLTLSAGLRVERQRVRAHAVAPTDGSIPDHAIGQMQLSQPLPGHSNTVFAPQLALTWRPGPVDAARQQEFYVYRATGYAPGNVDAARPTCIEPPTVYPSDKLHSIQVGTRRAWNDGRSALELELFQLDWDNGPNAWRTCLFMHLPGKARSRGLRFSARAEPFGGAFRAGIEATYVDARYRQTIYNDYLGRVTDTGVPQDPDAEAVLVRKGDALGTPPQVIAPWNVKLTLEKTFALRGSSNLTLRLIDTFHSRNPGPFYTGDPDAMYQGNLKPDPANNLLDGRAILERGNVDVVLYVSNLLNSRPVLSGRNKGNDESTLFYATTFRPRTFGLSVNWNFKGGEPE